MVPCADPTGARTADLVYRYSLMLAPLPVLAAAADVTSWMFAVEGMAINGYLIHLARAFKAERTTQKSSKVFMCSLWYLPALLGLMVFHKKTDETQEQLQKAAQDASKALCVHEAIVGSGTADELGGEQERAAQEEAESAPVVLSVSTTSSVR